MKTRGKSVNYLDLGIDPYTSRGLGNLTAVIKSAVYMEFNNHGTQQSLRGKLSMFRAKKRSKCSPIVAVPRKSYGEDPNEHAGHTWQRNQFWFETLLSGRFVERKRRITFVSQNASRKIVSLVHADLVKAKILPKTREERRSSAREIRNR